MNVPVSIHARGWSPVARSTGVADTTPLQSPERAFSLLEVMIALGVFFLAVFAILGVISNGLRNARALRHRDVDAGMVAAQLCLTNVMYEGVRSGDFGDLYPDYEWTSDASETSSNGLYQVDMIVQRRSGNQQVVSKMSIFLYRPDRRPGIGQ